MAIAAQEVGQQQKRLLLLELLELIAKGPDKQSAEREVAHTKELRKRLLEGVALTIRKEILLKIYSIK